MTTGSIRAEDFTYQHATRSHPALSGVSFAIEPGEKILLTGDSGSGKSTLLSAIAGLLADAEEGTSHGLLDVHGTVGLVLQDPDAQVISSRVGDDVAFGCENLRVPRAEIWPRVERALELVGLNVGLKHPTRRLSGGQKQRMALAGVIAMGADIILLDEPTANLDPEGREMIVEAVDAVARATGATVIIAEHRAHHWVRIVDKLWLLDDGISTLDALPDPPVLPPARGVPAGVSAAISAVELLTRVGTPHTLMLPEASSTVITGPNGAGKTTLALTLAGLLEPAGGRVDYAEQVADGQSGGAWEWKSSALASRIGYVFQDPEHQFVARSVYGEMAVSGASASVIDELLHRLRLDHLAEANPFTLSGGEKRRLSVATTLVNAPQVVLLDEPTFGQDDRTFLEMVDLLRTLADRGVAVASITHDEVFIGALGDQEVRL